MSESIEIEYTQQINENSGIIHKIISLYVDNEEDKKDVYQEVLLQGWKSYKNFKGASKFSTWLYKVTLNTVLTYTKKEKKSKVDIVMPIQTDSTANENHELLLMIIKKLDPIDKMLITLHLDGFKNIEIADITGMTSNNVNVKLYRLKAVIIERFKKVYHD